MYLTVNNNHCQSFSTFFFYSSLSVTGVVLRSDVYVHDIAKIEIVTTTRKLLLGEAPAVCHIQAFDKEGMKCRLLS